MLVNGYFVWNVLIYFFDLGYHMLTLPSSDTVPYNYSVFLGEATECTISLCPLYFLMTLSFLIGSYVPQHPKLQDFYQQKPKEEHQCDSMWEQWWHLNDFWVQQHYHNSNFVTKVEYFYQLQLTLAMKNLS